MNGVRVDFTTPDYVPPTPLDESCIHGLSLWLCADPLNHYPADM